MDIDGISISYLPLKTQQHQLEVKLLINTVDVINANAIKTIPRFVASSPNQ